MQNPDPQKVQGTRLSRKSKGEFAVSDGHATPGDNQYLSSRSFGGLDLCNLELSTDWQEEACF